MCLHTLLLSYRGVVPWYTSQRGMKKNFNATKLCIKMIFFTHIILPEVSKQPEGDEVPVRAQKGAVRLLHLAVLEQDSILGEQAQRHCVHQKHRQAELIRQGQKLFQ